MIYVLVEGVKSEGRGMAGGNGWHDTDDVAEAIRAELQRFGCMWDQFGNGEITTYTITVAVETSPRRTKHQKYPLPMEAKSADITRRIRRWWHGRWLR